VVADAFPKCAGTTNDASFAKDEAYRWIQMIQPREMLWVYGDSTEEKARQALNDDMQLDAMGLHRRIHCQLATMKTYLKIAYQEQTLQKIYGSPPLNQGWIERFDLERRDGIRTAWMYAIQFLYEHNEGILKGLRFPEPLEAGSHCCVHYNALLQLNVISHTAGERPLLSLLNRCATAFGSRLFKDRLLNPLICKETLAERYERVAYWIQHPESATVKKQLGAMLDLERFARRLMLAQLAPCDWVPIATSIENAAAIAGILGVEAGAAKNATKLFDPTPLKEPIAELKQVFQGILSLEKAAKYAWNDIGGSVFQPHQYTELDEVQGEYDKTLMQLNNLADALSLRCGGDAVSVSGACKLENNDRFGYYLTLTKKRWETVIGKPAPEGFRWKEFKTTPLSSSSSVLRISHPTIDQWGQALLTTEKQLSIVATECYKDFLDTHGSRLAAALCRIVSYLGDLDVHLTNARNAMDFCYCRPMFGGRSGAPLQNNDTTYTTENTHKSYIHAKAMRHPMIERLQTQVGYVPNDVSLGVSANHNKSNADKEAEAESREAETGWLLFGINASGKSSLMKAIGLNILMAQAGMFVPCASLVYEPYQAIFTRISGADNIYRGMSSFTVEMTELRNILLRCNDRSLVLGDELCAGTEALSALSIVAAGVQTLAEKGASFVFATHLHELLTLGSIPASVGVYHIHIELDEATQTIIYDRHLSPGAGHAYYGLEVCKALGLPAEFLKSAHQFRRKLQEEPPTFLNTKPSNYNKGVFMDKCAVCSAPATETHHIQYQRDANSSNISNNIASETTKITQRSSKRHIAHIPVHSASNLIPLCYACHKKEHLGKLKIKGYTMTSDGRRLELTTPAQNIP
jgi:DNA mismatch repair protein MutS